MALSCCLRKIPSPVLRSSVLSSLNRKILIPGCSISCIRQTNYHQLVSGENSAREFTAVPRSSWKPIALSIDLKQFSTSSALLASHKDHDHSKLWTFERLLSGILLPLVPAAFMYPSQALDTALALVIVLHTHFGFEAVVVDYIRPILFGQLVPKIGLVSVYILSILTFAGLLNLIYNDSGLANTIINIWKK